MSLKILDTKIKELAQTLNGKISIDNTKGMWLPENYEERSVSWSRGELNYKFQIYPEIKNNQIEKWIFWACCSYDTNEKRYLKKQHIFESHDQSKIVSNFDSLSHKAIAFLESITKEDLEFVVNLKNEI